MSNLGSSVTNHSKDYTYHSFVDVTKVIAIVLVLLDHNCGVDRDLLSSSPMEWWYAGFLKSLSKVAVPLFLMISGFTLLKPIHSVRDFYLKRLKRIAVPYLFWCIVYLAVRVHIEDNQISLLSAIRLIWIGKVYYHLWFISLLVGIYVAMPFFCAMQHHPRCGNLTVVYVAIWFTYYHCIPPCANLLETVFNASFQPNFYLTFFSGYLGFAILGHWIGRGQWVLEPRNQFVILAGLVTTLGVIVLSKFAYQSNTLSHEAWGQFSRPANVVLAACVMGTIRRRCTSNTVPGWVRKTSQLTLVIYFVHPLVIMALLHLPGTSALFQSNYYALRVAILFPISLGLAFVISKTPLLNRIAA